MTALTPSPPERGGSDKLPAGPFGLILADPAWSFRTYSAAGLGKSPQGHYDCMTLADIQALPVASVAAPDCALILWATAPMLPHALETMEAWGFGFKSIGAWAKQSKTGLKWGFGTGFILRSASEFWLIGTRGKPKPLVRNVRNLIVAPVREHSRKPEQIYDIAERLYAGPRLEMFSRQRRPDWVTWGNEVDRFQEAA